MFKDLKGEASKLTVDVKDTVLLGKRLHAIAFNNFRLIYVLSLGSIILVSVLPYVGNKIQGDIIDILIAIVAGKSTSADLQGSFFLFVFVAVLTSSLGIMRGTLRGYIRDKLRIIFSDQVTNKYVDINLPHYENPKLNDRLQRTKDNFTWVPYNFITGTLAVIADLAGILTSIFILFSFSPLIVLIAIFTSLPDFLSSYKYIKGEWELEEKESENFRNSWWTKFKLQDDKALPEIWVFGVGKYLAGEANKIYSRAIGKFIDLNRRYSYINFFTASLSILGIAVILALLFNSVIVGIITVGTFTFYLQTIRGFNNTLSSFLMNVSDLLGQISRIRDIFSVLDLKEVIVNGTKKLEGTNRPSAIEFKHVWFKYPNTDRYVFKDLNIRIDSGENVAFVGKNGAGKTTFVKLLCRFYDVSKGQILIDGVDVRQVDINTWYKKIALLSQDFVRYHFDAKTNIGLGDVKRMKNLEEIKSAAKKSGAHEFITGEFKKGYNQVLSKRFKGGTEPSTGQWQKIALARAFFKDAPVLILDEPTSAIDPKAEYEIFNNIFSQDEADKKVDKTILIISHRFSTVRNADRIIVIDNGKIVEQGSHEKLVKRRGLYREAFDLQKKGYV